MSRGSIPIRRSSETGYETMPGDQVSPWMQNAVEMARRSSIINDINGLIKNPPRYATVEEAVKDMTERTGLRKYLEENPSLLRNASDQNDVMNEFGDEDLVNIPETLKQYGDNAVQEITALVENSIDNVHGNASIPQLQYDIIHILGSKYNLSPEDINNEEVSVWLDRFLFDAQKNVNSVDFDRNLGKGVGKNDSDNNESKDYWAELSPKT